jgi:hypothetical protein
MCVEISGQQHRLEEDHAGVPHGGRPAEKGKHHLGDHRLHDEQE